MVAVGATYWKKIRVKCECGVRRQYDAKALSERLGDISMPSLLAKLSAAIGCEKSANLYRDRCKLTYDMPPGELSASRWSRPGDAAPAGEPDEITFANLPDWCDVLCKCRRCGHIDRVNRRALAARFGKRQSILRLSPKMRCRKWKNWEGNTIYIGKPRQ